MIIAVIELPSFGNLEKAWCRDADTDAGKDGVTFITDCLDISIDK